MGHLESLEDVLLITLGAFLGANSRFIIYKKFEEINLNKNYITLLINTFSSFTLGFFLSILTHVGYSSYSYKLVLIFSIGLLGSLSTFSTFIYDLFELCIKLNFFKAFRLLFISLISGIIFFTFGFLLGK